MQKNPKRNLVTALAGHLGMGTSLGVIFGFALVRFNAANLGEIIQNAADPGGTLAIFVGSLALYFGVGAALTGLIFTEMERR